MAMCRVPGTCRLAGGSCSGWSPDRISPGTGCDHGHAGPSIANAHTDADDCSDFPRSVAHSHHNARSSLAATEPDAPGHNRHSAEVGGRAAVAVAPSP